jgi:undecaprenyl-diphosphatase
MNFLVELDRALFLKINGEWTNPFFDWFFTQITDLHREPWALAILVPLTAFWFYKKKEIAFRWLLALVICVGLSDLISYRLIKEFVGRNRPEASAISVVVRTNHHEGPSFPSNHSANMFTAATIMSGAIPSLTPVFFLTAGLVAYSRVYVGAHFPLDVLGGALVGILIGGFFRLFLGAWLNRQKPRRR